jgi:hypothetical protein
MLPNPHRVGEVQFDFAVIWGYVQVVDSTRANEFSRRPFQTKRKILQFTGKFYIHVPFTPIRYQQGPESPCGLVTQNAAQEGLRHPRM